MSLPVKYNFLRGLTIFLGAVSIPLSTFIGFCFGVGRFSIGLVFLSFQTFLALADGYIWFWVIEHMDAKVKAEVVARSRQEKEPLSSRLPLNPVAVLHTVRQENGSSAD
ncbi:MAG: hypothetical protein V1894_02320 [Chloroflexota bacterium]